MSDHLLRCRECKQLKARTDFYEQKTRKSQVSQICKVCTGVRLKAAEEKRQLRALGAPDEQKCLMCNEVKHWKLFVGGSEGKDRAVGRRFCRSCRDQYMREHGITAGQRHFQMPRNPIIGGNKLCTGCDQMLPLDHYRKNASAPHGLEWKCGACMSAHLREYQNRNENVYWAARLANKRIYGNLPRPWIRNLFATTKNCTYCFLPFESDRQGTFDHRIPKAKGGKTIQSNVCIACDQCNRAKNDMTDVEFIEWMRCLYHRLRWNFHPKDVPIRLSDYQRVLREGKNVDEELAKGTFLQGLGT